jgi:UDPglucose 6-dehydrogenase
VDSVNKSQKKVLVQKVSAYYEGDLKGKKFALWGLAFKPDTDDIREAPSLEIIKAIVSAGAEVVAYDPEAMSNVKKYAASEGLSFGKDQYDVLDNADALLIATEWGEFKAPDFELVKRSLKEPVIFDGRNLYSVIEMQKRGFHYESIGRKVV